MKKSIEGYLNSKLLRSCRESFKDSKEEVIPRGSFHMKSTDNLPKRLSHHSSEKSIGDELISTMNTYLSSMQKKLKKKNFQVSSPKSTSPKSILEFLSFVSKNLNRKNEILKEKLDTIQDSLCNEYEGQIQKLEAESREHIKVQQQLKLYVETLTAREEELERTPSTSIYLSSLKSEKQQLLSLLSSSKSKLKSLKSSIKTEESSSNFSKKVSIDTILKSTNLENSLKKTKDSNLLAKYMEAKRELGNLTYLNKENKRPMTSNGSSTFISQKTQPVDNVQKRATRSISMANYPFSQFSSNLGNNLGSGGGGKGNFGQNSSQNLVKNSQKVNSYLQKESRVMRSQSIGEYLQKKLNEPNHWEQKTKRKF